MNEKLAGRITRLNEAETIKMARLSRELKEQGFDVINLSLGEPDFDTPDHIKQAAFDAINNNITHYTPVAGFADLRKAIAQKFKRDNELDYKPEQIIVSTGAKQSLMNVLLCLLEEGDEVIVPSPYWVSYPQMITMADAEMVEIKASMDNDFKITPAQLEAAITPKSRMFIFSSPCNPTGSVYSFNELKALAEVLKKHEIFVVSDEIYEYINYNGKHASIAQVNGMQDRTIVVNGVSKGFAMTGWRIGYMAAPVWLAKACEKLQGQFTSGASSISQMATLAAVSGNLTPTYEMNKAFKKRKELIISRLKDIPNIKFSEPEGAFYVFPEVQYYYGKSNGEYNINNADDLCMYLLMKAHVSLVPGSAFGNPECIRISFSASEEIIIKAVERVKTALAELK